MPDQATIDQQLATALAATVFQTEDFERPEGSKSFAFQDSRTDEMYSYTLLEDGTEENQGLYGYRWGLDEFTDSLAWCLGGNHTEALTKAADPARLVLEEIERIRSLPLTATEVSARKARRVKGAMSRIQTNMRWDSVAYQLDSDAQQSPDKFLERWDRYAAQGRCDHHLADATANVLSACSWCVVALSARFMDGHRQKYESAPLDPVPTFDQPTPAEVKHMDLNEGGSITSTRTTRVPSAALAAALRAHYGAPADAEVSIVEDYYEDAVNYTVESETKIEVTVGGTEYDFEDLGAMMRALDATARGDKQLRAEQFAGTAETGNNRGTVALYLHGEEYSTVGWITTTWRAGGFDFVDVTGKAKRFGPNQWRDLTAATPVS
jgi:hypothetical protein